MLTPVGHSCIVDLGANFLWEIEMNENTQVTDPTVTVDSKADGTAVQPKSEPNSLTMAQMLSLLRKNRMSRRTGSRTPLDKRKAESRAKSARSAASRKKNRGK